MVNDEALRLLGLPLFSAAVADARPDLVLMDVYLPDGDGLEVIRKRLETPRTPATGPRPDFVVITAARDVGTVRTAMQLGAVHYLVKPFGYPAMCRRWSWCATPCGSGSHGRPRSVVSAT